MKYIIYIVFIFNKYNYNLFMPMSFMIHNTMIYFNTLYFNHNLLMCILYTQYKWLFNIKLLK